MSDEMELLREFRADVPVPTEETRQRIYTQATQTQRRLRLTGRLSLASPRSRRSRWGVALVAVALAAGGAAIGFATTASGGLSPNDLLSQVQSNFGDGRLLSASVKGSTLTVSVAAPDEPSAVRATFEAQILASAYHDAVAASGQTPINSVQFEDASGNAIPGYGLTPMGSDTNSPPLKNGACDSAASGIQTSSLVVQSVLTLPYAGGACAFKFQTSDPSSVDGSVLYKLVTAMGEPNQRAWLVEVDDQAGVPQLVDDSTPNGGGVSYVRPGSGIPVGGL